MGGTTLKSIMSPSDEGEMVDPSAGSISIETMERLPDMPRFHITHIYIVYATSS